jgi:vacuolar protein sorting-associated protein VTA1
MVLFVMVMAGRLYAMEKGLKIPANERTKNTNALLASLMNQLEKVLT